MNRQTERFFFYALGVAVGYTAFRAVVHMKANARIRRAGQQLEARIEAARADLEARELRLHGARPAPILIRVKAEDPGHAGESPS